MIVYVDTSETSFPKDKIVVLGLVSSKIPIWNPDDPNLILYKRRQKRDKIQSKRREILSPRNAQSR
jgi:hypothetical protein